MGHKPTIADVAKAAGVGAATVDRVLNGRAPVREQTARRVREAATALGYRGAGLAGVRAGLPEIRLGIVLHKARQDFYRALADEIERQIAALTGYRATVTLRHATGQAPADFAEALLSLRGEVEVVASTAVNDRAVTRAVEQLSVDGTAVFSVLTDFATGHRRGYVGLDNLKVGRGAAHMLTLAARRPGKLALFIGGHRFHGHGLREAGFLSRLRDAPEGFTPLDTMINLETRQLTYEATSDLLHRHPDLRGLYVAGGGMEGAIAALREARAPGEVALVVNEATEQSLAALGDGYATMIVATPIRDLVARLLEAMIAAHESEGGGRPREVFLTPEIHLPHFE